MAQGIGGSAADALGGAAMTGLQSASLPEMDARGDGVAEMVRGAVNSALGNVQLTIPLNVDGMKLGEASIRGINAVTRSAGRVLLNI